MSSRLPASWLSSSVSSAASTSADDDDNDDDESFYDALVGGDTVPDGGGAVPGVGNTSRSSSDRAHSFPSTTSSDYVHQLHQQSPSLPNNDPTIHASSSLANATATIAASAASATPATASRTPAAAALNSTILPTPSAVTHTVTFRTSRPVRHERVASDLPSIPRSSSLLESSSSSQRARALTTSVDQLDPSASSSSEIESLSDDVRSARYAHGAAIPPRTAFQVTAGRPSMVTGLASPSTPRGESRRRALERLEGQANQADARPMSRHGSNLQEDLFLQLAQDQAEDVDSDARAGRPASRSAVADKRRSLPPEAMINTHTRRFSSSTNAFTPTAYPRSQSRLSTSNFPSDAPRPLPVSGSPTRRRAPFQPEDAAYYSGRLRADSSTRYPLRPDRSPLSPSRLGNRTRSPEITPLDRRRMSFGLAPATNRQSGHFAGPLLDREDSPEEGKQADSASADSQTAETVWDELDDLKSRIKKLELTGNYTNAPSAEPLSGNSSERPRTATTAPTTIDSSPKHDRKVEGDAPPKPSHTGADEVSVVGSLPPLTPAAIHPNLHAALVKAKQLLNGSLYRVLEATANDALQLAALSGSGGPSGASFSASSNVALGGGGGSSASDRQVRRKADSMCRNLTDLCLALCEGKHEASTANPHRDEIAQGLSASTKHAHSDLNNLSTSVPRSQSRLEARRTSILGGHPSIDLGHSSTPRGNYDEVIGSDQDSTPSHLHDQRRASRTPSNIIRSRMHRFSAIQNDDDDPTLRPPSRAMTEIANIRARTFGGAVSPTQRRSPSLRESLVTRRTTTENNPPSAPLLHQSANLPLTPRLSSSRTASYAAVNTDPQPFRRAPTHPIDHLSTPSVSEEPSRDPTLSDPALLRRRILLPAHPESRTSELFGPRDRAASVGASHPSLPRADSTSQPQSQAQGTPGYRRSSLAVE